MSGDQVTAWRKSSRSVGNGACVEAGHGTGVVGVRDSADPGGPVLVVPAAEWARFAAGLRRADIAGRS